MTYQVATITRQGQITIPSHLMVKVGLRKPSKVIIGVQDDATVFIKATPDFMKLAGALKHKAKKNLPFDEVIQLENKIIVGAWAEQAARKHIKRAP